MIVIELYGIRHHGPGSARSVREGLAEFGPDVVLIEGPPEADGLVESELRLHASSIPAWTTSIPTQATRAFPRPSPASAG